MLQILLLLLAALQPALTKSGPAMPPAPKASHVDDLGWQNSTDVNVLRDLSYSGKIGDTILNTYGDQMRCLNKDLPTSARECSFNTASDGVARMINPVEVSDYPYYLNHSDGFPLQFCPFYPDEPGAGLFGIGITNIVGIDGNTGMLFFLTNNRTDSSKQVIVGSGVARVDMTDGHPVCNRLRRENATGHWSQFWWEGATLPYYGDHGAVMGVDGYIYGFGGSKHSQNIFVTRVPKEQFQDRQAYEYWNGSAYSSETFAASAKQAILPDRGQTSVIWSEFFQAYLMLNDWWGNIEARLAYKPEGPWTEPVQIHKGRCKGYCDYMPSAMPWWDKTGRSLVITYSDPPIGLRVINVTWAGQPAPRRTDLEASSIILTATTSGAVSNTQAASSSPTTPVDASATSMSTTSTGPQPAATTSSASVLFTISTCSLSLAVVLSIVFTGMDVFLF